jgi:AAA family ATP:ADP antiporter
MAATCGLVAASMLLFWWLFQFPWAWIPFVLYVWISIAYVMNVSQFWSFSNHLLDPRQARRLFGFIGAGGLLGGIAGGQIARLVSELVDTRTTFLVAALILMLTTGLIYLIHYRRPAESGVEAGAAGMAKLDKARGGFEVIKSSPQLQLIAAIMVLSVMVAQIVDLQFNWVAEEATENLEDATQFFGNFFTIMGISAFLFQLLFTARIHRVLGVKVAMQILPVTMALGTSAVLGAFYLMPSLLLGAALLVKVGENGVRYSLEQATRELLFLPVPSRARVKAKAFIDVFVQRGAKGLAALLLLPVTPTIALITPPVLAGWLAFPLIAVWLVVTVHTYREYVRAFKRGLKKRSVDTGFPIDISDPTTLELLVRALGSSDHRQVLQSLDILTSNSRANLVPPLLLYHDNPEVRHRTLRVLAEARRVDAVPLIERLLADKDPEVRALAVQVLAELHGADACDLMLPRLKEADAGVRAAAVACLANYGGDEMLKVATSSLSDLLSDADNEVRAEGARALGAIHEPRFQERLVQLLYDRDPRVVREAIAAVRRRVARDGFNPLYVPTLISLLQSRRVKHEAREALVAFGEPALPALTHFMGDTDEPIWVRRALPRTIAKIGTLAAAASLSERLAGTFDPFLRRKLIDAFALLPEAIRRTADVKIIDEQIQREARSYLQGFIDLQALGFLEKGHLEGPRVVWSSETFEPSLVEKLLAERLEDHLHNLFGLLLVTQPARDVWAAYRSLTGGSVALRTHALEYLDNTLTGEVRRAVFAVIGDQTLDEKLNLAAKHFGAEMRSKISTLDKMLNEPEAPDAQENYLTPAALYTIHADRITDLYSRVRDLAKNASDPFVSETAAWVFRRLGLSPGG